MENIIIIAIIVVIVGGALGYIIKAKHRGQKCIGCPYSDSCGNDNCSCGCGEKK